MKKEYNIKVNTGENTLLLMKDDDDDDDDDDDTGYELFLPHK